MIIATIAVVIAMTMPCKPPVCMPELIEERLYMPFVAGKTKSIGEPPTPIQEPSNE